MNIYNKHFPSRRILAERIEHAEKVLGIILNDCEVLLDFKFLDESSNTRCIEYSKGLSHIQGLCNGLKKRLKG